MSDIALAYAHSGGAPLAERSRQLILVGLPVPHSESHAMTADAHDRILRLNSVLDRTGLSPSTLYRKIQAGTFPRQIRIAARCAGWRESAVAAWLRNPVYYEADD